MKNKSDIQPTAVSQEQLRAWLADLCPAAGIEMMGAVPLPCPLPHRKHWDQWIRQNRYGGLEYLAREPDHRADPHLNNPWAKSVLVMAHRYTAGWPANDSAPSSGGKAPEASSWVQRVSRYARGDDYHKVLLKAMKQVLHGLRAELPDLIAFPATDTGPYLEREYAWLAGLGFLGHNNCLIHEKLGSGLFLGVALSNLEIHGLPEAGQPVADAFYSMAPRRRIPLASSFVPPVHMCGSCTRCLDACPTDALDISKGMDAGLCLSSWSIEWRGQAPEGMDHKQGGLLFGCDICQAVCPWNNKADRNREHWARVNSSYEELPHYCDLKLLDLETISDEKFREFFHKTPLWRCHPEGMRRNAQRVRKNLKGED